MKPKAHTLQRQDEDARFMPTGLDEQHKDSYNFDIVNHIGVRRRESS
jgi:hypothetical protein